MTAVEGSVVAGGLGGGRDEYMETRGFLGSEALPCDTVMVAR